MSPTPFAWLTAKQEQMHNDLPALAAKIGESLSISSEYVVTQPAELRVLRDMSENEVREFAKSHGWHIIRRLGGRQIEFYNDASARAL
jgi:hypothetical protein